MTSIASSACEVKAEVKVQHRSLLIERGYEEFTGRLEQILGRFVPSKDSPRFLRNLFFLMALDPPDAPTRRMRCSKCGRKATEVVAGARPGTAVKFAWRCMDACDSPAHHAPCARSRKSHRPLSVRSLSTRTLAMPRMRSLSVTSDFMLENSNARRTDSASRVIAASPHTIYRAFVDPDAWIQWLPPQGMTGRIYEFNARPGGAYRVALTYRDPYHPNAGKLSEDTDMVQGRFVELIPNERVIQIVTFESDDRAFAGEMRITWCLSAVAGGTAVSITCENVPKGLRKEDHDMGLRSTLENLAKFVESSVDSCGTT